MPVVIANTLARTVPALGENGRVRAAAEDPGPSDIWGPARLGKDQSISTPPDCHAAFFWTLAAQFTARCKEKSRGGWLPVPWHAGGAGALTLP